MDKKEAEKTKEEKPDEELAEILKDSKKTPTEKKAEEKKETLNRRCGEILRMALSVETDLDFFISNYFSFPPSYKTFMLNDVLVDTLQLTFAEKTRIFERICKEEKVVICENKKINGEEELKSIIEAVEFINKTRNQVSHWMGFIEKSNQGVELQKRTSAEYKEKELDLTDDLVEKVHMNRLTAQFGINKIYFALLHPKGV